MQHRTIGSIQPTEANHAQVSTVRISSCARTDRGERRRRRSKTTGRTICQGTCAHKGKSLKGSFNSIHRIELLSSARRRHQRSPSSTNKTTQKGQNVNTNTPAICNRDLDLDFEINAFHNDNSSKNNSQGREHSINTSCRRELSLPSPQIHTPNTQNKQSPALNAFTPSVGHLSATSDIEVSGDGTNSGIHLEYTQKLVQSPRPHNSLYSKMSDELKAEIEKQRRAAEELQQQVAEAELKNELEAQMQQQEAWKMTLAKLEEMKTERNKRHKEKLASLQAVSINIGDDQNPQMEWLKKKMEELGLPTPPADPEQIRKQEEATKAKAALQDILTQQKQLAERATEAIKGTELTPELNALLSAIHTTGTPTQAEKTPTNQQDLLMEQLKASLMTKNTPTTGDWQKDVLRQFLTNSSKTTTAGGATTLKPDILKRLTNEQDEFSMADWLATLNRKKQVSGQARK